MNKKNWQIINKNNKDIIDILLENRGLNSNKEKEIFFNPIHPKDLKLKDLGINKLEINKAIKRINKAKNQKEKVIVYGDYDADGISATAIMWEALHKYGLDVLPYIPNRFSEGYGINPASLQSLKKEHPGLKLIVTVDNGIAAFPAIKDAARLGIDVIITDHHQKEKKVPKALSIVHTTQICGSALAWIFARELGIYGGLELAAIGTIADQMPLIRANRSFAKLGLKELSRTKRVGLLELLKDSGIKDKDLGAYEVNYIIAPRINSMGRLANGIDSLRLLCTKDAKRAKDLSSLISKTNLERQSMVEKTIKEVQNKVNKDDNTIIFLSSESYHEGIIGLAAGKLVEEYYRPAIVISKGKKLSKGSARSINGFNIIEAIREHSSLLVAHGGHVMAAGFTIETSNLEKFQKAINKSSKKLLTKDILARKKKIDCEIDFSAINWKLSEKIKEFEPTGLGNPSPTFLTKDVEIKDIKLLGKDKSHLKLKLEKNNLYFDAVGFGMAKLDKNLQTGGRADLIYSIEENSWNGTKNIQLKIKDINQH